MSGEFGKWRAAVDTKHCMASSSLLINRAYFMLIIRIHFIRHSKLVDARQIHIFVFPTNITN